jgi:hypothetical protein
LHLNPLALQRYSRIQADAWVELPDAAWQGEKFSGWFDFASRPSQAQGVRASLALDTAVVVIDTMTDGNCDFGQLHHYQNVQQKCLREHLSPAGIL